MTARLVPLVLVLCAAPVAAQVGPDVIGPPPAEPVAPDVVGTWELVAAENVPVEDELVFARLTFGTDRFDAVYVFLDPDDAELSGRFERGRYLSSAGQLVVREGGDVTVFDVARDATQLTVRDVETGVVLLLRAADPALARDPDLVGAWAGARGGRPWGVRFDPDGRAEVREGDDRDTGDYVVAGPYVLLGDDPARYTFARDADGRRQLVVEADGERTVLSRVED
ncbi:hypothetical protein [Rubrivirga sp.]|uniref:hypothetical protein n=1 Tax=Rubrivirga sp. TaxID=1885344 RepID=UPI003B517FD1